MCKLRQVPEILQTGYPCLEKSRQHGLHPLRRMQSSLPGKSNHNENIKKADERTHPLFHVMLNLFQHPVIDPESSSG